MIAIADYPVDPCTCSARHILIYRQYDAHVLVLNSVTQAKSHVRLIIVTIDQRIVED